jgi:hypothetical protein
LHPDFWARDMPTAHSELPCGQSAKLPLRAAGSAASTSAHEAGRPAASAESHMQLITFCEMVIIVAQSID